MKSFLILWERLESSPSPEDSHSALRAYFASAPPADASWAAALLGGHAPKRVLPSARLREWAGEAAGLEPWLVEECVRQAGDSAEAVALLLPPPRQPPPVGLAGMMDELTIPLAGLEEADLRARVGGGWDRLDAPSRLLWNKLLTGTLHSPVARPDLARALGALLDLPPAEIEHRLAQGVTPTAPGWAELTSRVLDPSHDPGRPYPFHLAEPLSAPPESLGPPSAWRAEWFWDGLRLQVVRRRGQTRLIARDGALLDDALPEITAAAATLPDGTVLDGMVLAWGGDRPRAGADLRRRLALKSASKNTLRKHPVVFLALDLLEFDGADLRAQPLEERLRPLHGIAAAAGFRVSEPLPFTAWRDLGPARASAPARQALGLVLKQRLAPYATGRERGAWWKWPSDPRTVRAVLMYAQADAGECTFGVWKGTELVPVAKVKGAISQELDAWIRHHTVERFGPVRQVQPGRVAELRCAGVEPAPRAKAGLTLRDPDLVSWRADLAAEAADRLEQVRGI